jgi:hypothetical protein
MVRLTAVARISELSAARFATVRPAEEATVAIWEQMIQAVPRMGGPEPRFRANAGTLSIGPEHGSPREGLILERPSPGPQRSRGTPEHQGGPGVLPFRCCQREPRASPASAFETFGRSGQIRSQEFGELSQESAAIQVI